jgi:disulfide oxidoreductase YuzD
MEHRYSTSAQILYHDVSRPEVIAAHDEMVGRIQDQGLIYPVTVIDGEPVYDGAVSYPAILRAIQTKLTSAC